MRIDCYNACETEIGKLQYGDTFYYESKLYIKFAMPDSIEVDIDPNCYAICLSNGQFILLSPEWKVIYADTKVVANE